MQTGTAVFSGQNINYDGITFRGAELNAAFGGIHCDLSNSIIKTNCTIRFKVICGGIRIKVPDNVNVIVRSSSIFGGVVDKTHREIKPNTITLVIDGICLFGGMEII